MICKYCGREIDDNATFCPYCGKNLEEKEIVTEVVEVAKVEEKIEEKKEERPEINSSVPVFGLIISICLYICCFLMLKLENVFRGFGDYVVFLLLIPLGIIGMILSSIGRHFAKRLAYKIMGWVSFGVLLLDYVLLFVCLLKYVG